jgi:hypothetical protein
MDARSMEYQAMISSGEIYSSYLCMNRGRDMGCTWSWVRYKSRYGTGQWLGRCMQSRPMESRDDILCAISHWLQCRDVHDTQRRAS